MAAASTGQKRSRKLKNRSTPAAAVQALADIDLDALVKPHPLPDYVSKAWQRAPTPREGDYLYEVENVEPQAWVDFARAEERRVMGAQDRNVIYVLYVGGGLRATRTASAMTPKRVAWMMERVRQHLSHFYGDACVREAPPAWTPAGVGRGKKGAQQGPTVVWASTEEGMMLRTPVGEFGPMKQRVAPRQACVKQRRRGVGSRTVTHEQVGVDDVLDSLIWLVEQCDDFRDAFAVMAFTQVDLCESFDDDELFIAGRAYGGSRVGVFSTFRYMPSPQQDHILLGRCMKIATHEMGHIFGLEHCVSHWCLFNGSSHLEEDFAMPFHACYVCMEKLRFALPDMRLKQRYECLLSFFAELDAHAGESDVFADEVRWLQRRCELPMPQHELLHPDAS